jgi:glycosyltransferase involved in cell wall biosynthesis
MQELSQMEITRLIQNPRTLSILNRYQKNKTNVFVSIYPINKGGGSNTFAYNIKKWLAKNKEKYNQVYNMCKADKAIIIADKINIRVLEKAKKRGCFIIHRLDEHVESNEDDYRRKKHAYIKELNALADVTVYQSNFVFENMHPYLGYPDNYKVIHNGADPKEFYPNDKAGEFIGHVTWGVGDKKRLDILYEIIVRNPDERFLLVGNHFRSGYDFAKLSNVKCIGNVKRQDMLSLLHKMKFLFFPSENDPCPNTAIEAILAGVSVCYNNLGGTKELVMDCGVPVSEFSTMLKDYLLFRKRCLLRNDLGFDTVAQKYMELN